MDGHYSDKYAFLGEWYDNEASQLRKFNVFYYPNDDTIEMYDLKLRKIFLRRVKVTGITIESFYIGATLNILGRLVKILDFRCEDTKQKLQKDMEITFALSKPMPDSTFGKVLTILLDKGLRITRMKKSFVTVECLNQIYRHRMTDPSYPFLIEYMQNHYLYGMELVGKNAVDLLKQSLGDPEPSKAAPGTVRALHGLDLVRNCLHESASNEIALEDIQFFFDASIMRLTPTLSNCTMCIVKPHALKERKLGLAIQLIDEGGFDITALNMFNVEKVNAGEFYEVYKGIVQEYKGMVEELASGSCVGMEIVCKDKSKNSAAEFRKLVGPTDPEIARLLRPHTLRAILGVNKVKNAIHCSDLPEDGLLEVEYFFKILEL